MTLKEKVLQTFVVTIREINTHGGPQKFFEKYPVGGMYYGDLNILCDENGLEIGTQLTHEKLTECKKYSQIPLFVCADETKLKNQEENMSSASMLASENEEDAYNFGKIQGMQMNESGIDWILQPATDFIGIDHKPFCGVTNDYKLATKCFAKAVDGIQDQGVCATVKHFPGLGASTINMHFAPGRNELSFDEWMESYGFMYKEMIKHDTQCIMTTHISLKSYDNEYHDGFCPIATFSHKLTTELLKEKLGFKGAVVTDALIMGGMATGDLIKETVQAFKAGADFLLWPPIEAADEIVRQLESGEIPMSRLDDALSRIERVKNFRKNALEKNIPQKADVKLADEEMRLMTKRGLCLYKNDLGLIPLKKDVKKFLIVDISEGSGAADMLRDELIQRGYVAKIKNDIYDVPSRVCWQKDIDKIQDEYDMVIFSVNVAYENSWGVPFMKVWASHLFSKIKKIIINYSSSFMIKDFFPDDPTIIDVNACPRKSVIKYIVDGLEGKMEFKGKFLLRH